jgi:hypothetical protein
MVNMGLFLPLVGVVAYAYSVIESLDDLIFDVAKLVAFPIMFSQE